MTQSGSEFLPRAFALGIVLGIGTSFATASPAASVVLTPRFEMIEGYSALARRSLLRAKVNGDLGPYAFFFEGFGDAEGNRARADQRRVVDTPFVLQEAYVEFKKDFFYLRAGKQALRWSEMWVLPSLDVWTARRWNRFLFDPQPEQLEHSGGVSTSYAQGGVTLDAAIMNEPARSRYPQPLPEFLDEQSSDASVGGRAKIDVGSFTGALVGARVGKKEVTGVAFNYAFERVVPKLEIGKIRDAAIVPLANVDEGFVAAGLDIFLGDWTLQPQATWLHLAGEADAKFGPQTLVYLGGTWRKDRHDLQFQTFGNSATNDFFFNAFYGYNWRDWCQLGAFVQDYEGAPGTLYGLYRDVTGGWVGGLRLELNTGFGTD